MRRSAICMWTIDRLTRAAIRGSRSASPAAHARSSRACASSGRSSYSEQVPEHGIAQHALARRELVGQRAGAGAVAAEEPQVDGLQEARRRRRRIGAQPAGGREALRRGGPRAARRVVVRLLDERGRQLVVVAVRGLDAVAQRHGAVGRRPRGREMERRPDGGRDPLVDRRGRERVREGDRLPAGVRRATVRAARPPRAPPAGRPAPRPRPGPRRPRAGSAARGRPRRRRAAAPPAGSRRAAAARSRRSSGARAAARAAAASPPARSP